jgi:hypothetical protein
MSGEKVETEVHHTETGRIQTGIAEDDFIEPPRARFAACPNCQYTLHVHPTRTRKCLKCKLPIVVRTNRADGAKLLLTEGQAAEFDRARKAEARLNAAIRHASNAGFDREQFEQRRREMATRAGSSPAPRDVFWSLAEEAARAAKRQNDWERLRTVRYAQAMALYLDGGDYVPLLREASRAELLSYQHQGIRRVQILSSGDERVCKGCKAHNRRRMSIPEALDSLPIPNDCINEEEWCRCVWLVGP